MLKFIRNIKLVSIKQKDDAITLLTKQFKNSSEVISSGDSSHKHLRFRTMELEYN